MFLNFCGHTAVKTYDFIIFGIVVYICSERTLALFVALP
jgi:hypothetical protein